MNYVPSRRIAMVVIYGAAMGWVEAVVVVYIRSLLGISRAGLPATPEEFMRALGTVPWLIPTEQGREAATMIMLLAVAALAGRSLLTRFGAFLAAFGVWDITYYIGLWSLIRWPSSLATRDLLFLIPPSPLWNQPVWVPVLISCGMILVGTQLMRLRGRQAVERRAPPPPEQRAPSALATPDPDPRPHGPSPRR